MKKVVLLVSTLILVLIIILTLKQEGTPEWGRYQTEYFKEQLANLQIELGSVRDDNEKQKLLAEIESYRQRKPEIVNLTLPNGETERCKTCHIGIEEISNSHPSDTMGCAVCHGGNPLSLDKTTAHAQMNGGGHPGSLDVASLSCGGTGPSGVACHSGNQDLAKNQVDTVKTSIMSTKAGELSVVRRMFGIDKTTEVPGLDKVVGAYHYPNPLQGRPNEEVFQQDCLSQCHQSTGDLHLNLKNPQSATAQPATASNEKVQANGCEACHVLTNPTHTYIGNDPTIQENQSGRGMVHRLTTQIPYTQCNQCHNQGTHDPIKMKLSARSDIDKVTRDWQAGDLTWTDRVRDYYLPGEVFARCEVSLDCIDCHTKLDTMGDGEFYTSQHEAVHIQCLYCHGTKEKLPQTKKIESPNELAVQMQRQITNPNFPTLKIGDEILVSAKGEELAFLRHSGEDWIQSSRVTGKPFKIPLVIGSACEQNPEEQGADSCHKCHDRTAENP
ncbi:Cytochrome c family protein [Desulfosporosinus sp. I2]|uniref:hypothetical protein n=1 Tax=Desulfosporosinus sp. I2 TaxID=1617025 RepID=UPI0005F0220C|nr:hypothetical protein [Desulfosporosinus sp. I2]KJR46765.1 Cytochrome c family protein [Desulfosporosinus sp. I2]